MNREERLSKSLFAGLPNVKGMVAEDVRITDSPLCSEPVLEIRVRRAGACSDAPNAEGGAAGMTRAARASLARSGLRLPASRAGRRDAPRGPPTVRRRGRFRAVGRARAAGSHAISNRNARGR